MNTQTLFEAPLAHQTRQHVDYCTCPECSRTREDRRAAQWLEQAAQEGDLFDTQLDFKFTRTPEGHEVLTRLVALGVPTGVAARIPGGLDLPALLRGVTRPDKRTGSLPDTIKALVHSMDPDVQKSHALRKTWGTSTAAALSEIRKHLMLLHDTALRAGRAGAFPTMFEWIGEALHLIQDSYSQAHTQRDSISIISAPHPIRKVRFFGFVSRFPPSLSQAPDEHQVKKILTRGQHVGDPRDAIHDASGALKPEAEIACGASLDYLLMVLNQIRRPPSPSDVAELTTFMDWHLSSHPVVPFIPPSPGPTPGPVPPPGPAPRPGPVPPPSPRRPMLRRGSRGRAVRELQARLNRWIARQRRFAMRPLAVDGIFGPLTQGAVQAFQRAERLKADGIVGPLTWGRLLRM